MRGFLGIAGGRTGGCECMCVSSHGSFFFLGGGRAASHPLLSCLYIIHPAWMDSSCKSLNYKIKPLRFYLLLVYVLFSPSSLEILKHVLIIRFI